MVLGKSLESPLDYKEIKPVNPKEINPEHSLEVLMLRPKLANSLDPDAGKIEGRTKGWQRMRWLDGSTDSMDEFEQARRTERPGVLQSMGFQRVGHD